MFRDIRRKIPMGSVESEELTDEMIVEFYCICKEFKGEIHEAMLNSLSPYDRELFEEAMLDHQLVLQQKDFEITASPLLSQNPSKEEDELTEQLDARLPDLNAVKSLVMLSVLEDFQK